MSDLSVVYLNQKVICETDRVRVFLKDCWVELSVGYHPAERLKPQPLIISVEAEALLPHRYHDTSECSLDRVIDYERFYIFIRDVLPTFGHIPLLETVAEQIISCVFEERRIQKVSVRIEKPQCFAGTCPGIEVSRTRPNGMP